MMMKIYRKLSCLFLLLLVGCTARPETPPFVYNEECPHVCWLNINPGLTTMEDTRHLVATSNQISKLREGSDIDINNESGFTIKWHTKQMGEKVTDVYVGIIGEHGIVSSVTFNFPAYINLEEFIGMLGEPDEISVMKQETAEITYVEYILYYTKEKVLIASSTKDLTGPEITDPLGIVYLNIDLSSNNLPKWATDQIALRQPWLGFEKMDEYLLYR
jgi:hypothetical protein